jgi:4-carboxymuconolactone decarboxylase
MKALEKRRMKKGFEILRKMGREQTMFNQKALYPDLYDLSVGYLFGEIWSRPHLTLRERQLITLASNIALARPHGTHSHYRSAKHLGFTHEEIMEVMIQVGMYAGWPAVAHAIIQYEEVLNEDAAKDKVLKAKRLKAKKQR